MTHSVKHVIFPRTCLKELVLKTNDQHLKSVINISVTEPQHRCSLNLFLVVIMFITFVSIETGIYLEGSILLAFKFFGEIFGIIAGAVGIYLSRSKNDKDMKCLWKGYITLVSWNFKHFSFTTILSVQCVFTTVSSFIGFIANVVVTHAGYLDTYYWSDYGDSYSYKGSALRKRIASELSLVQILTIETFLFFGKTWRLQIKKFVVYNELRRILSSIHCFNRCCY